VIGIPSAIDVMVMSSQSLAWHQLSVIVAWRNSVNSINGVAKPERQWRRHVSGINGCSWPAVVAAMAALWRSCRKLAGVAAMKAINSGLANKLMTKYQ